MSDDFLDRIAVTSDPTTEFSRAAEIRAAAQQALFKRNEIDAMHRVHVSRPRVQPKYQFREGEAVYVWRNSSRYGIKGWVGHGVIVCINEKQSSAWVSMRGVLVKTNTERMRPATDQEWLGV